MRSSVGSNRFQHHKLYLVVLVASIIPLSRGSGVFTLAHGTPEIADASRGGDPAKSTTRVCSQAFTRDIRPVCGSDGKIYNNLSIFKYKQCMLSNGGVELTLAHMSLCDPHFDDTQDL